VKYVLPAITLAVAVISSATSGAQDPASMPMSSAAKAASVRPIELTLQRAASRDIDLRALARTAPVRRELPPSQSPEPAPRALGDNTLAADSDKQAQRSKAVAAPPAIASFDGLDFSWGSAYPPDVSGDVGPTHYIQAISSSIAVYQKSSTAQVAAFTFNTFMSQGAFGNQCDTQNVGMPVVLYDSFEDRWLISDVAYSVDGSGNVSPAEAFQCIAVSKSGDPVAGGWNFYSVRLTDGLNDSPKLGVWRDGIYMSSNIVSFGSTRAFQRPRVWAFNKAQMYAGAANAQIITFDAPSADFTLLPSNARLQTGTPPAGTPNYFVSTWQFLNAVTVYKFKVDWVRPVLSTFTGPDAPLAATSWPNANVANAPSLGGNTLDVVQIRAMAQNQYSNLGGIESLWAAHTVRRANTTGFAAPRWYQVNVTGGTVAANLPQAATFDPDGANVMNRFIPSLAVNRNGDLALGYSTSSSTTKPAIQYAGRLASDPVNTFSQTEQMLLQGAGTQTGNCYGSACIRWGSNSAMTLDPDGCTYWYSNQYYSADGLAFRTRITSFAYPSCTAVGAGGTLSGTVTATPGGAPVLGATVALGGRSTTTDAAGNYSFTGVPAGTYPALTVAAPGRNGATASDIAISDAATTTRDFALSSAPTTACFADTTMADFQTGIPVNVSLADSPGDVTLLNTPAVNQQNLTLGTSGVGITVTTWGGQTFTPSVTGTLTQIDVNLFCSGCTGTIPNLTLSVRATAGGLPTGADLASATINGFNSGSSAYYTAAFAVPLSVTAGTQYALVVRPTANPSPGTYALTRSGTSTVGSDVYGGGTRVAGATSGTVWSIPLTGGVNTDAGFKVYISTGYAAAGSLTSAPKDSNPGAGQTPAWLTINWAGTTPASTGLSFKVAASNSATGPFNFVGPDGTAATSFTTTGASLSQFDGSRYLQYRADLTSTDNTVTPTLSDITLCYTVTAPPVVTQDPADATVNAGSNASFTAAASGSPAPTVQWQVSTDNGANYGNVPGATSGTLPVNSVLASQNGERYRAVFTNGSGSATSTAALLTVNYAPAITGNPSSQTIASGSSVSFVAAASGNPAATVQWFVSSDGGSNYGPVAGATSTTLGFTVGVADNGNLYRATFTNGVGSATTTAATLTVTAAPAITSNPGNATVTAGTNATFTAAASGLPAPTVQWQLSTDGGSNFGNVPGATSTTLNVMSVTLAQAGHLYRAVFTNGSGSATTTAATLSVNPGAATHFTITAPASTSNGASLSATVTARDAFNNVATSYTGTAHFTSTDAAATLPADYTFSGGDAGVKVVSLVLRTVGNQTLSATDTVSAAVTGTSGTIAVGAVADIGVTAAVAPNPVTAGSNLTYTLTVSNSGPDAAAAAVLSDTLPANTTFVSLAAASGWSCTAPAVGAAGTVSCSNPSFATVGNSVFTLVLNVNPATANGTAITNSASVTTSGVDPAAGNNTASASATVSNTPSVTGLMSVSGVPYVGNTLTYTVVLTNGGTATQQDNPGAEFTDVLPPELQLLSASATSGAADAATATNTATWNGSIAPGASVTITIQASIRAGTTPYTVVRNQGSLALDLDGNGSNESTRPTDDAASGVIGAPTLITVALEAPAIQVPAIDDLSKALLALLLLVTAGVARRRYARA